MSAFGVLEARPEALGPSPATAACRLSGEAAAVDAEAVYQHLCTRIPAEHFHSPLLALEFVQFCRASLPLFGRHLGVLRSSFPNLFKARASSVASAGLGGWVCRAPGGGGAVQPRPPDAARVRGVSLGAPPSVPSRFGAEGC